MSLKTYYVREIGTRKEQYYWVSIRAESETNARDQFIKEMRLRGGPEKSYLTRKHIAVRTTPPSRGGVGHFEAPPPGRALAGLNYFVVDPVSRRAPRKAKSAGKSLVDRQMAVLIQKSDELKVNSSSEDWNRETKKVLLTLKPRSFLWTVNKYGSRVWPLDTKGKGRGTVALTLIEAMVMDLARSTNKDYRGKLYLVTRDTIREISPKEARTAVERAKMVKRGDPFPQDQLRPVK